MQDEILIIEESSDSGSVRKASNKRMKRIAKTIYFKEAVSETDPEYKKENSFRSL